MEILRAAPLQSLNSLALPATAQYLCRVTCLEEWLEARTFARERQLPITVLGGGSNTVLAGDVAGLVVVIGNRGITLVEESADQVVIQVAAGENWHQLVMHSLEQGWYGLENLALIPGCVGAAPIQNIGAYGVELADVLSAVEVIDMASGERQRLTREACEPGYRDSVFKHRLKGRVIIWSLELVLSKAARVNLSYPELAAALSGGEGEVTPLNVARAVCDLRRSKLPDPATTPNAGSFFKNPVLDAEQAEALVARYPDIPRYPQEDGRVKFPAAWLIDRAGWKGRRAGAVGVHDRQALVLVHLGGGSGGELLALADRIAADVTARFGVALEMEPVVIGGV